MIGSGIVKGMAITARNFIGSYFDKERLPTIQYPEEKQPLAEATRNFPFLVYDNNFEEGLRCVSCKICEKECPPQCIYIVQERDEKGKPVKRPRIFDIDVSVCMGCGICAEVCPFESIKMDKEYEMSRRNRFDDLVLHLKDLAKSNEYYHKIRPTEATAVDAALAEAAAKKKK